MGGVPVGQFYSGPTFSLNKLSRSWNQSSTTAEAALSGQEVSEPTRPAYFADLYNTTFSGSDYTITAVIPSSSDYNTKVSTEVLKLHQAFALQRAAYILSPTEERLLVIQSLEAAITQAEESKKPFLKSFAEIQTLSISSRRSVSPVRRMGEKDPAFYVRGGRTTAGSMVFAQLDGDALLDLYRRNHYDPADNEPYFAIDRIPPFNISIVGINEYGYMVQGALFGVTLLAHGQVLSVDDMYTEQTVTYVALHFSPLARQDKKNRILEDIGKLYTGHGATPASSLNPNSGPRRATPFRGGISSGNWPSPVVPR